MSNILIILEGNKPEVSIINQINNLLELGFSVQIIYGSTIYELYRSIISDDFKLQYDDSVLNTFDVIKELIQQKSNDPINIERNQIVLNNYKSTDFAFIYMFFDFDPQAAPTSKVEPSIIKEMLELFNEPTEHGKLYINYPSIESFNDICSDFNSYYFDISAGMGYKQFAGQLNETKKPYLEIRKLDKSLLSDLLEFHLIKANYICNSISEKPNNTNDIEQSKLFEKQLAFYNSTQKVYIISSIPLFLFELMGTKLLNRN